METTAPRENENPSRSCVGVILAWGASWDTLFLALIILLGAKVNWGVGLFNDIRLADETVCLYHGTTGELPPAQFSPLYCGWYFLLSLLESDSVDLYFLNWFLLPILLGVGIYLLIRSLGGAEFPAFGSAAVVLLCRVYDIWPRPMHFAVCLLLFGLAIGFAFRGAAARLSVATLTVGVTAFARPGFAISFFALALLLFAVLIRESYRDRSRIGRCLGLGLFAMLPAVLLSWQFGNPLGGGRSDVAFGQHYALNKHQAGLMDKRSNPWHNFEKVVERDFGSANVGPLEALWTSPENFLWHVSRNVSNVFSHALKILDFGKSKTVKFLLKVWVLFVLVAGCAIAVAQFWKTSWRGIISEAGVPLVVGLAVIAPVAAACLVIYPREHYLVCLLLVPFALMTSLVSWKTFPRILSPPRLVAALLAGAIVLFAPNHYFGRDFDRLLAAERSRQDPRAAQPVLDAVKMIREVPWNGPLRVAGTGFSYFVYTDQEFTYRPVFQVGHNGYAAFLKKYDINVVVLRSVDTSVDLLRQDEYFMRFRKTPPAGWVIIGKRGVRGRIAVRRDALAVPFERLEHAVAGRHWRIARANDPG